LDFAGKTQLLASLRLGSIECQIPTIGMNIERVAAANAEFFAWDLGGCEKIRTLWIHFYKNTVGIIFVVDSTDKYRMPEVRKELYKIFVHRGITNQLSFYQKFMMLSN
jgi:GTPase SAR1 family protein